MSTTTPSATGGDTPWPGIPFRLPVALTWLRGERTRQWLRRKAVAAWMNVLIAGAAVVTVVTAGFLAEHHWPEPSTWGVGALKLFALWCLSFLPGWLYVRFLGTRAQALWSEYVLTLHRLGWDRPRHLPEPLRDSDFYAQWSKGPASRTRVRDNIYRQKFEAYYGRQMPGGDAGPTTSGAPDRPKRSGETSDDDFVVSTDSLFPVFLATAALAVGWSAVLWDTTFLTAPAGIWDVLKYGFLGAYAFVTGMLIRRFFQSDLRPSAYATAVLRIILVLLIVAVLHQVVSLSPAMLPGELAAAFLVGFFPLVGLQVLQRTTSKLLRVVVPPLTSDYPLEQLDGLNLWYEARLTEEGVEDMQNLATMNLVDVILHTRVPAGRLVDWLDQAFLLIHLGGADRADLRRLRQGRARRNATGGADGADARVALRQVGIRTATDLLKALSQEAPSQEERPPEQTGAGGSPGLGGSPPQRRFVLPPGLSHPPLPEDQLRLLVRVLAAEPGLAPVWNWQRNGVPLYPG